MTETSPAITITIDNAPPTTSVLIPSNDATVSGTVALDASATAGVFTVGFLISGNGLSDPVSVSATPTIYGWLAKWNTETVPNGTYTLQSVADYMSLLNGLSLPVTITVDNAPPATSVLIPSNNAVLSGTETLDASASAGVSQVEFVLSGGPDDIVDWVVATATPTIYGWLASWTTSFAASEPGGPVPDGGYTLQSVASYFAGGDSGTSPPISITVDN